MWFIGGMILGAFIGLLVGGMCNAAGRYDDEVEELYQKELAKKKSEAS